MKTLKNFIYKIKLNRMTIISIIFLVILVLSSALYIYKIFINKTINKNNDSAQQTNIANWVDFKSDKYQFSFKYPINFIMNNQDNLISVFSKETQTKNNNLPDYSTGGYPAEFNIEIKTLADFTDNMRGEDLGGSERSLNEFLSGTANFDDLNFVKVGANYFWKGELPGLDYGTNYVIYSKQYVFDIFIPEDNSLDKLFIANFKIL